MADPFSFAIATVAQVGISYLFPSDGPRIKDLKVSASTYGNSIPQVFGLCRVPGNMIWATKPVEHKKKKSGKGGFYNEYTYTCSYAMGLCVGPIRAIKRIWADSKLIYDATGSGAAITGKYKMRFYMGDETQLPDSLIEADKGSNATAFRGMAYVVFDDMLLTDFGNRIPQITAEVYVGETEQNVSVTPFTEADGTTPNPSDYVAGEAAFDWDRDFAFLRYDTEIVALNLRTSRAIQRFDNGNFRLPGGASIRKLYGSGGDSSIYVAFGADTSHAPFARLDAYSLQAVQVFGTEGDSGTANTESSFATPVALTTAYANSGVEYLLTVGANGEIGCLRCSTMEYQWGADTYIRNAADSGRTYLAVGASADASGNPTFYVLDSDSTSIHLTEINGSTQTDVLDIAGAGMTIKAALWDNAAPGVIFLWTSSGVNYISKWSQDTGAEIWRVDVAGLPSGYSAQSRILAGRFAWVYAGHLYIIDTVTGEFTDDQVDPATGDITPGNGTGYALPTDYAGETAGLQAYDSSREMLNCFGGIEGTVFLNTATVGCSVGSIVDRLLTTGGLSRAEIDLSTLNSISIRGYGWASGTDVKSIIDEMQRLFLFDLVEREGVLVAVLRGDLGTQNGVATIPQDVLGSSSPDAVDFWQETRTQEADLPAQVTLTYINYSDDYQTSIARSARVSNPVPSMFSRQQVDMQSNIVLTPSEAKAQTRKMLYSQWSERVTHSSRLPQAYLNLDPGDVINVNFNDGRAFVDRLNMTEIGADWVMTTESYSQDSGAYDGWDGVGADGGGSGSQTMLLPSVAVPFVMNVPLLRDMDDTGGSVSRYYTGLGSGTFTDTFYGGVLFRSTNNIDYDLLGSEDNDLEWGTVIGTLGSPFSGNYALDWKTRLTILPSIPWFELESITDDELWAGANPCLVGDEVIQFRDAVENDDGTWTIWNLLRGRRGTEYACDTHAAGERFVFLNNATITLQADITSARGLTRYFKGVGQGRSLDAAPVTQIVYEPRDLMPYAPAYIQREYTTSDDIDITWQRRTRLGGNLQDGTGSVALSESLEAYEIYILDAPFSGDLSRGAAPTNYLRMYTSDTNYISYSAEDQASDGFDASTDTLHLAIYQLSGVVGRGFPGVRDIAAYEEM